MAYQLPHESSTKRKFNNYSTAGVARMNHDETLPLSLKTPIQFFVRMFSGGKTLVIQADSSKSDCIDSRKIQSITEITPIQSTSGVPAMEHRLIYSGKQLYTCHHYTWKLMSDLNLIIHDLYNCNDNIDINDNFTRMTKILTKFLEMTPRDGADKSEEYLQILIHSSVPAALVKLYVSRFVTTKQAAHGCICQFIDSCRTLFANRVTIYRLFAPIVSEFCKILRGFVGVDDDLYIYCRSSLAAMMKWYVHNVKYVLRLQDGFPFVREMATRLSRALELSVQSAEFIKLSDSNVHEFSKFMHQVKCTIRRQEAFDIPVNFPSFMQGEAGNERLEIEGVHCLCLKKLESQLGLINKERGGPIVRCWSQYLLILKELENISKLFKVELCFLIVRLSKKSTDYQWILEHKEMLREGRHKNEQFYEMLICRFRLFEESCKYIGHASPRSLRGQLFIQFENEEATGPGVLREWFSLVCEAIFNPQNALFVSCPNDGRRFFPNPVFIFSGRMIALALWHRVQISIAFDRVFFWMQILLAKDRKKILEMDTKMVDEDILGLTFVCEDEELGSRKVVDLCPNGKNTIVNSKNRDNYVSLLVKHRFVTSIAHQVAHFARCFADIITDGRLWESFYRILDYKDLHRMLHGSKTDVSVEDWKEHTNYNGYKKNDPQISWLWEIVGSMSAEKRNVLLFFWTSIKSLPVEGFGGLDSKLHTYRTSDSHDFLPSSHTCFYRLCFPPYLSMDVM
ncbi:hypothetical protein R3W88_024134 [Solanum pinnatisectum]|uniref:HECT-type E3 ubiquitin transferase n=1 Tax=Solanum pinnatisectum TaxID=50273 RepID=A0AAV9LZH4_9SOLN|nr:hypothetical protein R3W88_024134 [Solanum pinnatisectum]